MPAWLALILQLLPGLISSISGAINGPKPASMSPETQAQAKVNDVHLQAAHAHFMAAQDHLSKIV